MRNVSATELEPCVPCKLYIKLVLQHWAHKCTCKKPETESATSVRVPQTVSTRQSSCLANCNPLYLSVHYRLLVQSVQEARVFGYILQIAYLFRTLDGPRYRLLCLRVKLLSLTGQPDSQMFDSDTKVNSAEGFAPKVLDLHSKELGSSSAQPEYKL